MFLPRMAAVVCVWAFVLTGTANAAGDNKVVDKNAQKVVKKVLDKEVKEARNYVAEAMLNAAVRSALLKHLAGADGLRISVSVERTNVILSGEVKDRASMRLAGEVARSVKGVKAVSNRVKLSADSNQNDGLQARLKDAMLESDVKLHVLAAAKDAALHVDVEAADGVVSVRGVLASDAQKQTVLKAVKGTAGVREVKDLLRVEASH